MDSFRSRLTELPLDHKKVLLRFDGNVPIEYGKIVDDYRLEALRPTLDYLKSKHCTIILATHIGRPEHPSPQFSTQHLMPWFTKHGYPVTLHPSLDIVPGTGGMFLLENLRFFPGELTQDPTFTKQLARLADFYVTEAFGSLHRKNASVVNVPMLFPKSQRTFGFLVEKELNELSKLITGPKKPFIILCGGGKAHDKIPLLLNLMPFADTMLILPAIAHTFAQELGKQMGKSIKEPTATVRPILEKARETGTRILLPRDYQIANDSFEGPLSYTTSDEIPKNGVGISIGPKTIQAFDKKIAEGQTIFFNGIPGLLKRPETLEGARELLTSMAHARGYTVIGGGDTVAVARLFNLDHQIDFCSTGGGATLAYLSGTQLPGLAPFIASST
ncbi:phosphoglycerate kinase [Candidatus Babeliales bacterium]|nr:phosphoglycerate kinase [Candidatus Babeliales bacterium]